MSFYGLEIAKTGLFTSQKAITLSGHNIANAHNEGYTRQRLVTSSIDPAAAISKYAPLKSGKVGGGVEVNSLGQIRNTFIDKELRREYASLGQSSARADALQYIEKLFDETNSGSISSTMANFFDSLQDLTTDAASKELRTSVQQNALAMTETFNHYYNQLLEVQKSQNNEIKAAVDNLNNLITSIGVYNKQIFTYELGGEIANDLRDKRNVLIDDLAHIVNIDYYENSEGKLVISVEGTELVNHVDLTKLVTVPDQTGVVSGAAGFYSIYYEGTATEFEFSGGKLEAFRNMRDGNSADDLGVPYIINNLNTLARSMTREFNALNSTGYTVPYGTVPSTTGINLFHVPGGNYDLVTAESFRLSDEVLDNVFNIAASDTFIDLSAGNSNIGNNKNMLLLVELTSRNDLADVTNFESFYKDTIVAVGVTSEYEQTILTSQTTVVDNLETRKQSISGVSIDEEMTEMIKWQHSYAAASRIINAIDEQMDILINKVGLVGR